MSKSCCCILAVLLSLCALPALASPQIDLTASDAPARLAAAPSACATKADLAALLVQIGKEDPYGHTDARIVQPWRPPPNIDPESGGGCWNYTGGNYDYGLSGCPGSPYGCVFQCENNQQSCVQSCYNTCGNTNNTNGSCFENCGDTCRSNYDNCVNGCT
jgi:hypothetical protein